MDIEVRLATAQDRSALEQFYAREGQSFQRLSARAASTPVGASLERMFVVAVTQGMVVAALRLDIGKDPEIGRIGFIKYFEIEDELEHTDLGTRMLEVTIGIAEDKNLRALDTLVPESRPDVIGLYQISGFEERCKEIYLRKTFRLRVF